MNPYLIGKNTIFNLLGYGLPIIVAIFALPPSIAYFGDDRFGVLSLAWLIIGSSVVFDFGMGRAATKFVAEVFGLKQMDKVTEIIGAAIRIQILIGIIVATCLLLGTPYLIQHLFSIPEVFIAESKVAFYFCGLIVPFSLVISSYRGALEATQRFDVVNIFRVVFSSLTFLNPVFGMVLKLDLGQTVALLLIFYALQIVTFHICCKLIYPTLNWSLLRPIDNTVMKNMFSFGSWVALSNILSLIQENIERVLLASLLPIALVTYYSVPKDMLDRIYVLPSSLCAALFPLISIKSKENHEDIIKMFAAALKAICFSIGAILIVLTGLAEPILALWLNKEFALKSSVVINILSFGVLASSVNILAMITFQGSSRPDITAKQQLIRAPIIVLAAWLLISEFGLIGAAFSWTFGRLLALGMNLVAIQYCLNWHLSKLYSLSNVIALCAFPVFFSFNHLFAPSKLYSFTVGAISLTAISLVLFLCTFFFSMNQHERSWLYAKFRSK